MRVVGFGPEVGRDISAYASQGLRGVWLLRGEDVNVTVLHLDAGGEVGKHPAAADQLFLVTAGRGEVCGGDGTWHPIGPGQAAIWAAGEEHITRAGQPMTAVVIEAPFLSSQTSTPS